MQRPNSTPQSEKPFYISDEMYRSLINVISIPTWIEDFSEVKYFFDHLRATGVHNFRAYFETHPEDVIRCASMVKILEINEAGLKTLHIDSKEDIPQHLSLHFNDESWPSFCEELIALAEGRRTYKGEITARNLGGGENVVEVYLSVPAECSETLARVVISFANLTVRKRMETALRESEERYRILFENSPVGIAVSQAGTHILANPAYLHLFGFSRLDEIVGTPLIDRVAAEGREKMAERNQLREQGQAVESHYEVIGLRQDGSVFPAGMEVAAIPRSNGLATLLFVQDVTAQKWAEEAERGQRQLAEAMSDMAAALNRHLDLDQILDTILDKIGHVVGYDTVDIALLNENNEVYVVRERGYAQQGCQDFARLNIPSKDIPNLRRMIQTGQPIIMSDIPSDPDWVHYSGLDWVRSYAGIPIQVNRKVIGFINLSSASANFYQPYHAERLRILADQVAIAFTNVSLVNELVKANKQLSTQLEEIQKLQEELRNQAIRDPLTGLFNRRYLLETLCREVEQARRDGSPVGIIVLDIDNFKSVNDANGHKAGDLVLVALAELLLKNTRLGDIACRYGGEEFVVVMPGAPPAASFARAEKLRIDFEALRVPYEDRVMSATISLGVAVFPMNGASDDEVLIRADRALYQAKQGGRNRTILYQNSAHTSPLRG